MAREKELFREYLERLDKIFPEKELLNVHEVSKFCGISEEKAKQRFPFTMEKGRGRNTYYISKGKFANELS